MREIKFRAYIKHLDIIVDVQRINFDVKTIEVGLSDGDLCEYDFDEVILMQYTGLKDRHGQEIYEGDVMQFAGATGKVIFETPSFWWDVSGEEPFYDIPASIGKVIGNIYDNPELLRSEADV